MKTKTVAALCALMLFAFCHGHATAGSLSTGIWSNGVTQHLYVSDPGSRSILRFAMHQGIPNQRPDAKITGLNVPRGIAIGPDNRLYVIDAGAHALLIYEPSPGTGSKPSHVLSLPHAGGLAAVGVDGAGFVYVGHLVSCGSLGACGAAAVYAPLPNGTPEPIARYRLGGTPPVPFVTGLAVNSTHHLLAIMGEQPNVFADAPKRTWQTPFPIFCPPAAYGGVWGNGTTLYFSDTGKPSNPPRAPQVVVVPNYLQNPNCPSYFSITSATLPLKYPIGIAQQQGMLYVTTAYTASVGSGVVFVFDSTKQGAQTPLAILDGPGSQLNSPWGLAIGP